MTPIVWTLTQLVLVLSISPFTVGLVRWFKARMQGRVGASPFLPYWTIATLLRKELVVSSTATWIFRASPFVVLSSVIFLAAVLPLLHQEHSLVFLSQLLVVSGVLMLGSVFLSLGSLDTGTAFGGMGASRELTLAALGEPLIVITLAAFAAASGSSGIGEMVASGGIGLLTNPGLVLSVVAFIFILLAENARYPVDNPATHLELTMIHEAMLLEYSGPYLAMLEWASAIKLTVFSLLLSSFVWPQSIAFALSDPASIVLAIASCIAKIITIMFLLALLESSIPKMRFYRMQEYLSVGFFLGLAGLIVTLASLV